MWFMRRLPTTSPHNEENDNQLLDPVSNNSLENNNLIVLSTGYAYNLGSVSQLLTQTPENTHNIKHKNQNDALLLLPQDITHLKEVLSRSEIEQGNQSPEALLKAESAPITGNTADSLAATPAVIPEHTDTSVTETNDTDLDLDLDLSKASQETIQNTSFNSRQANNVNISNADLSDRDLSTLTCTKITLNEKTNLTGAKISQEIIDKSTPQSKPFIAQALAATYYKKCGLGGWFSWNAWKIWAKCLSNDGKQLDSVIESLTKNIEANKEGASCAVLKIHGLYAQNSNATALNPNSQQVNSGN
jgi:hypothetical protein